MNDPAKRTRLDPEVRHQLGTFLSAAARTADLSGSALAAALGWDASKISRLFAGKIVKTQPYQVICALLGLEWDDTLDHARTLADQLGELALEVRSPQRSGGAHAMDHAHDTRIITICAEKGGVGKTTLAANLACALFDRGHRTLLVDLDGQANLTALMLGGYPDDRGLPLLEAIRDQTNKVELPIVETAHGPDLAPSGADFGQASQMMSAMMGAGIGRVRRLLGPHLPNYDRIIIDTPPQLGPLVSAALRASTDVIISSHPTGFSIDGVHKTLETCRHLLEDYNAQFTIQGVAMMAVERTIMSRDAARAVREMEEADLLEPLIPRAVAYAEADASLIPALRYDPGHKAIKPFKVLARHLEERWGTGQDARTEEVG